jgi:ribosomal protein S18 acetylase RimI-like enzyme
VTSTDGVPAVAVAIRLGRESDRLSLAALHARSRADAYAGLLDDTSTGRLGEDTLDHWTRWFAGRASRDHLLLVAEASSGLAGFGLVEGDERQALLRALHVHPDWHGRGVGSRLHDGLVRWCGMRTVHLHVLVENAAAREFYRRRGWADTGERLTHRIGGQELRAARYHLADRGAMS